MQPTKLTVELEMRNEASQAVRRHDVGQKSPVGTDGFYFREPALVSAQVVKKSGTFVPKVLIDPGDELRVLFGKSCTSSRRPSTSANSSTSGSPHCLQVGVDPGACEWSI